MKLLIKLLKYFSKVLLFLISIYGINFALSTYNVDDYKVNNNDINTVINQQNFWEDPLRQWVKDLGKSTEWIVNPDINSSQEAQNYTLDFIRKIVNYFISILAFVALVVLIYGGVIALTASWDDNKFKQGLDLAKKALISIVWIWLSWLIVSFIFYIIFKWF
jgi:hypothetical protein